MKAFSKKVQGETLLEVVTSLAIVAIVLIGAYSSLSTAMRTNVSTEKKITALNLAREGIEVVRSVRDTNWLEYSGSRRDNWDCYEEASGLCISHFNSEEYFLADSFATEILQKIPGAAVLDIKTPSTGYESFRLKKNLSEKNRYEHGGGDDSIFYRQISVSREDTDHCISGANNNCKDSRLKVVSRVQWSEERGVQEFVLQTYLYDFFERTSYSE